MRKHAREVLLREYVKRVLTEDEGDVAAMTGDIGLGAESPYGISFGSREDLISTFVTPFTDVFKTALGKTKEITRKSATLLWVGLQTVLTTLLPFWAYDYKSVFDAEKDDIDKIREQYRDVYERTDQALASNDAALLAFMASPAAVLSVWAAKKTPGATLEILSAVTGGISDKIYDSIASKFKMLDSASLTAKTSKTKSKSPSDVFEAHILEQGDKKKVSPKDVLKNKEFLEKALSAPAAKEMQEKATKIYKKTLNDVYKQASDKLSAKSIEDFEKLINPKAKGAADVKKKISDIKKMPPEEQKKAVQMLIDGSKKATKDFYVKNLSDHLVKVLEAGIPEESQYVKDYKSTISKIKSL